MKKGKIREGGERKESVEAAVGETERRAEKQKGACVCVCVCVHAYMCTHLGRPVK